MWTGLKIELQETIWSRYWITSWVLLPYPLCRPHSVLRSHVVFPSVHSECFYRDRDVNMRCHNTLYSSVRPSHSSFSNNINWYRTLYSLFDQASWLWMIFWGGLSELISCIVLLRWSLDHAGTLKKSEDFMGRGFWKCWWLVYGLFISVAEVWLLQYAP